MTGAAERPLRFACGDDWLFGVLHTPATPATDTGLLVVVGGPQYRAGSHRQFTQLARHAARRGVPVLRFDVRGMGDSTGSLRPFDMLDDDIGAAIDALLAHGPGLRRVVLWGLCDGASASLLYAGRRRDPRVGGLALLNPWVRTPQGLARTHARHYYGRRLLQRSFWQKLVGGGIGLRAVGDWWRTQRMARRAAPATAAQAMPSFTDRMASAWQSFPGPLLLVLSGEDFVAKEFLEICQTSAWLDCLAHPRLTRVDLPTANHTFSDPSHKARVEAATVDWLLSTAPNLPEPAARHRLEHTAP